MTMPLTTVTYRSAANIQNAGKQVEGCSNQLAIGQFIGVFEMIGKVVCESFINHVHKPILRYFEDILWSYV